MKNENQPNNVVPIDLATGEVVPGRVITPAMEQEIKRKKQMTQQIQNEYKDYGQFYWLFYKMQEDLFDKKIDGATITRLVFLATYMGYDNCLYYKNNKPIYKDDLQSLLRLKSTAYKTFTRECKENCLIKINNNGTISITNEYFKRGKLLKRDIDSKNNITRMYCDTIQYLYKNCDPRYQKTLSYMFALIPHISIQYNIVCENPLEEDIDKVRPCLLRDICAICNYDPSHSNFLKKSLINIKIQNKAALRMIEDINGTRVYVNPAVYYGGNNHETVYILGKF